MATKKGGKTNKTAHVLNVLAGASQDAIVLESEAEERQPSQKRQPPRPNTLEIARADDDALAQTIRDNLQELEEGLSEEPDAVLTPQPQQVAPVVAPEEPPVIAEEPSVMAEEPPVMAEEPPVIAEEPSVMAEEPSVIAGEPLVMAEEPPVKEELGKFAETSAITPPAPASLPKSVQTSEMPVMLKLSPEESIGYVNIMQALVEEKAPKYIDMFKVCTCPRCIADVKALALTNLPAKYAVMEKGNVIPMLTVYEGRFSSLLTAQLIKACERVSSDPRHE